MIAPVSWRAPSIPHRTPYLHFSSKPGSREQIESFPYIRYGCLIRRVVGVSRDAIQNEKRGLRYQAEVRLNAHRLNVEGTWVNLSAGMQVSAEIKTGKRRVITYLLSPLQQHTGEALRER